jgi:hypothetical protein
MRCYVRAGVAVTFATPERNAAFDEQDAYEPRITCNVVTRLPPRQQRHPEIPSIVARDQPQKAAADRVPK